MLGARGAQLRRRGPGLLLVQRVAGAEADLAGAALLERALGDGLDAARLEEVRGEGDPGRGRGGRAERGQVDPGPGPGRGEMRVGAGAERLEGLVAPDLGRPPVGGSGAGARSTGFSVRWGNSLTPVIGSRRVASFALRAAQVPARRSPIVPDPRAARWPPARSMSWKNSQAACASSSVSRSTYQEPPAGSITRERCDSSMRTVEVLRAIRRANASGRPSASSNGSTVTLSAPPTPAASVATVVRSMFTHGSRRVIITVEVTACWRWAPASRAPQTSATRAHSRRAARSLAIVRNWSAVAA